MRDLSDMKGSFESSVLVQAGLLAMAFGGGMVWRSGGVAWWALLLGGAIIIGLGAMMWTTSRKKAYLTYLSGQTTDDLKAARVDASSEGFLKDELKRRKTTSAQ